MYCVSRFDLIAKIWFGLTYFFLNLYEVLQQPQLTKCQTRCTFYLSTAQTTGHKPNLFLTSEEQRRGNIIASLQGASWQLRQTNYTKLKFHSYCTAIMQIVPLVGGKSRRFRIAEDAYRLLIKVRSTLVMKRSMRILVKTLYTSYDL